MTPPIDQPGLATNLTRRLVNAGDTVRGLVAEQTKGRTHASEGQGARHEGRHSTHSTFDHTVDHRTVDHTGIGYEAVCEPYTERTHARTHARTPHLPARPTQPTHPPNHPPTNPHTSCECVCLCVQGVAVYVVLSLSLSYTYIYTDIYTERERVCVCVPDRESMREGSRPRLAWGAWRGGRGVCGGGGV